ncbi:MAG TPA: hypothetical protein VFZ24_17150 [Longimicrobiales bacterium]
MNRYAATAVLALTLASAGTLDAQKPGQAPEKRPSVRQTAQPRGSQARPAQAQRPDRQQAKAQPQQRQDAAKARQAQGSGGQAQARPQQRGQGQDRARPQQQRGQGQADRARPQPGQGQGQGMRANARADGRALRRVSRPVRLDRLPERFRPLVSSRNPAQRAAAVALARGTAFGSLPVSYALVDDRVRLLNRDEDLLLELDDDEARRLGYWDIRRLDPDRVREGAPAFCRSGAGHPVWGREWCIDKGFGLGASDDWRWGRHYPDDIFFRTDDRVSLDRGGLADVLGSIIFGRLALHALTLGLDDPLGGRWIGEPTGPSILLVDAGPRPVAELVDLDRDGDVDVMYVTSR